ncbi:MAG: DUF2993 domain-containing protein [Oculatellaceae cyanobacterium bins.114]|nr:DUF2993 domain-containing protein [Oculatellaceae cyanobacterium bins.114]
MSDELGSDELRSDEPKLEERAIAQMVEAGLSSQVEVADDISVDVHTDLLQAAQGQVETTSIKGKGLVVQEGIRLEEVEIQTDRVAINPIALLFGQLKLKQPLNSTVRVVLTESDLNNAANSDVFIQNLPSLTLEVQGQPVRLSLQAPLTLRLPAEETLKVSGQVIIHESDREEILCFKVVMSPRLHEQLLLQEFCCEPGKRISLDLAIALMQWINEWIKAPYIEIAGVACRINDLKLQQGQLEMTVEAHVDQIPDSNNLRSI